MNITVSCRQLTSNFCIQRQKLCFGCTVVREKNNLLRPIIDFRTTGYIGYNFFWSWQAQSIYWSVPRAITFRSPNIWPRTYRHPDRRRWILAIARRSFNLHKHSSWSHSIIHSECGQDNEERNTSVDLMALVEFILA